MPRIGYQLSSEEHAAQALVRHARLAEDAGFDFLGISDHFHPWLDRQGHSPFVWAVLGGIAQSTRSLPVGTAVTCPIVRMHPALVAHAAATVATMMPGRFFLGLGTGERLNEHVLGGHWPTAGVRLEMLEEAVEVVRLLLRGELTTHNGTHFRVENARLYDVPDEPPPIYVAAAGDESGDVAGRVGDGLISTAPSADVIETFRSSGGGDKPRMGMTHVCWAPTRQQALETAHQFANTAVPGILNAELPLPRHYEAAASVLSDEQLAEKVVLGDDPEEHAAEIRQYAGAGFDHVLVHHIGPDQEGFTRFYADKVLPLVR